MRYSVNPFKVLGATPFTDRAGIVRLAEEGVLFADAKLCADAQGVLLSPAKRLEAEICWFLDVPAERVNELDACARARRGR